MQPLCHQAPKRAATAIAIAISLIATVTLAVGAGPRTAAAQQDCWRTQTPVGALPGQPGPVFCTLSTGSGSTAEEGPNTWIDEFDHGLSLTDMTGSRYEVFEGLGGVQTTAHWRHADHWMVDVGTDAIDTQFPGGAAGGAMMRPDRTFRFEDGKLVVEAVLAASMPGYDPAVGGAWGEIDITTGAAPTQFGRGGSLYGYDYFPGHYTLGCRYQADSVITCSLFDNTDNGFFENGRIWEMSFFQIVGDEVFGGADFVGDGEVFDECLPGEADAECRMNFRLELTETSLEVFVDGERYFAQTGIPPLPNDLMTGDLHVYASSMLSRVPGETIRFHWDRLAINPEGGVEEPPGCTG